MASSIQAVYYMVSQVPPGHFTGITTISDLLHSGASNVGSALRKTTWLSSFPIIKLIFHQARPHRASPSTELSKWSISGFTDRPTGRMWMWLCLRPRVSMASIVAWKGIPY
jgi:alkylated DNA nucleotide flippase Atl1